MDKKTVRERVSRLQGIAQLIEKLSIRFLRLLCSIGVWLAAPCVLTAVLTGYAALAPTGLCDAVAGASHTAPASPSAPRFAPGGPDAEDYGASDGYPIGDRATFLSTPFLVGSSSHLDQVFEGRLVRRATTPSPLARAASEPAVRYEYRGQTFTLEDYLMRNPTTGLLVARGDTILIERYQYARHDRHRFTSWSMAKTVTAMLVGVAVAEGRIRSVDDPAAAYVPALAGTEYGRTSLRHLLQMSSGVRFVEAYSGRDDVSLLVAYTFRQQVGAGGVDAVTPFNVREAPSGTKFAYASAETQVLGLVLRAVVGRPVADYLHEKIWEPMGAEADATWLIDRAGQEATYCCLNAVLRDYARLGLLLAHDGHWRGQQLIPRPWIEDATRVHPDQAHLQPGTAKPFFGYGYQVWLFPGERRMFGLPSWWAIYGALDHAVRTGIPATEQVLASGFYAYFAAHPEESAVFNAAMVAKAHGQVAGILATYNFSSFQMVGDIGGGRGHLLRAVLEVVPTARGVLFDLPHVVQDASGIASERLTLQAGDFFKDPLPVCDAYLVMEVIHAWGDQEAMAILQAIRRVAPAHAKILLIEQMVPDDPGPHWSKMLDIHMLTLLGGRQRTRQEYEKLFDRAGFAYQREVDTGTDISILRSSTCITRYGSCLTTA